MLSFGSAKYDPADDRVDYDTNCRDFWAVLSEFVHDTSTSCAFYARRFGNLSGPLTPEAFHALPVLRAAEIRSTGPTELLPDRLRAALIADGADQLSPDDTIVRISQSTSSSGGPPKVAFYTRQDWAASARLWPRLQEAIAGHGGLRILNCFHPGHGMGRYIDEVVGASGNIVVNRHHASSSVDEDIEQLSTDLAELGGYNCIAAPAWSPNAKAKGASLDLLLDADIDNRIGRNIRLIITAGAPVDDPAIKIRARTRDAAEMAGRPEIRLAELYGGTEVGIAAGSCASGGLHLFNGPTYGEILDPDTGQPTADGEIGRVTVTGLRHGSRYVRYMIGDEARVHRQRCSCGRRSPRISEITRVVEPERLQSGCAAGGRT